MTDAPSFLAVPAVTNVVPAVTSTSAAVVSAVSASSVLGVIKADIAKVETDAESFFSKAKPYLIAVAGAIVGYVVRSLI